MIKVTELNKWFGTDEMKVKVTFEEGYHVEMLFDCDPVNKNVGGSESFSYIPTVAIVNACLLTYAVMVELEEPKKIEIQVTEKKIKPSHEALLLKLQAVMNEMVEVAEADDSFNELLGELNESKELFGHSLDAYDLPEFIEEYQTPSFDFMGQVITNPYYDETLRFEVDPAEYYGLTAEQIKMFKR